LNEFRGIVARHFGGPIAVAGANLNLHTRSQRNIHQRIVAFRAAVDCGNNNGGGHPCGADYVSWDSGIEVDDVLVLIAYAVLPPAIASLAVVQLAQSIMNERARRFREKKRR
jgi:hypothetical protein